MVRISGDNVNVPGQVTVLQPPSSPSHVVTHGDRRLLYRIPASIVGINVAGPVPYDGPAIPVGWSGFALSKYLIEKVVALNPTADHSAASVGLYSGPNGTGTEIIAPTALVKLTANDKFQELPVSALDALLAATNLYPHIVTASANAGTVDLVLFLIDLSTVTNMN